MKVVQHYLRRQKIKKVKKNKKRLDILGKKGYTCILRVRGEYASRSGSGRKQEYKRLSSDSRWDIANESEEKKVEIRACWFSKAVEGEEAGPPQFKQDKH